MELLLTERFVLLDILPKEGDYATLKELLSLRMELGPDAEELERFHIKMAGGRIEVPPEPEIAADIQTYTKECIINSWAVTKIQEVLRNLNSNHKLTMRELSLYDKFIVAYDQV